jgi:thiosulfate dehydrogenase
VRAVRWAAIVLAASAIAACAVHASPPASAIYAPGALPAGALGAEIRYGREIIMHTRRILPQDVRANMDCAACHAGGGTVPRGGSFLGLAAAFPQWNKRSHRVIALQDRIAECFLYSMNGKPPPYTSRAMIAVAAYITWLSRGTPVLTPMAASQSSKIPLPHGAPDVAQGRVLFAARCAMCHGANGAGGGPFPPLWGSRSFNDGAGMSKIATMTGFVYYNMPKNAPRTLTAQQAYDIAGFVLTHSRPAFDRRAAVAFPALPAGYF